MDNLLSNLYPNVVIPNRPKGLEKRLKALYMCLVKKRNLLKKFLEKQGIETKIHYPIPLNKQKAAKNLKLKQNQFKNANYQSSNLLTLPIHQYLKESEIRYIAKIKEFYSR